MVSQHLVHEPCAVPLQRSSKPGTGTSWSQHAAGSRQRSRLSALAGCLRSMYYCHWVQKLQLQLQLQLQAHQQRHSSTPQHACDDCVWHAVTTPPPHSHRRQAQLACQGWLHPRCLLLHTTEIDTLLFLLLRLSLLCLQRGCVCGPRMRGRGATLCGCVRAPTGTGLRLRATT